jgi:hypothetical protein
MPTLPYYRNQPSKMGWVSKTPLKCPRKMLIPKGTAGGFQRFRKQVAFFDDTGLFLRAITQTKLQRIIRSDRDLFSYEVFCSVANGVFAMSGADTDLSNTIPEPLTAYHIALCLRHRRDAACG